MEFTEKESEIIMQALIDALQFLTSKRTDQLTPNEKSNKELYRELLFLKFNLE